MADEPNMIGPPQLNNFQGQIGEMDFSKI